MPKHLTAQQRDRIASDAARRYAAGESWAQIAEDHGLHRDTVRRLTVARHDVSYRRWGAQPAVPADDVMARRQAGETIPEIAEALGHSQTAVRTALETASGPPATRYPRLSTRRFPRAAEVDHLRLLYDACPPLETPGARDTAGEQGRPLAAACRALVDDGVPMQTLSLALGRGPTWAHWLLGKHDLRPKQRAARSTRTATRRTNG